VVNDGEYDGGGVGFGVWAGGRVLVAVGLGVDEGEGKGVGSGVDVGVKFGLKATAIEGPGE
jgi:hypothetical protein